MNLLIRRVRIIIAFALLVSILNACKSFVKPLRPDGSFTLVASQPTDLDVLISNVKNKNNGIDTFKGLGKITLNDRGKIRTARLAWAGSKPDKLRIEVLDVAGRPSISVACDGKWLYYQSHTDSRAFKKHVSDSAFQRVLLIDILPADLVALLSGGVPVAHYQPISLSKNETNDKYLAALKDG